MEQSPFYYFFDHPFLVLWYQKKGKRNEAVFLISSKQFLSERIINSGRKKYSSKVSQLLTFFLIIIGLSRPQLIDKIKETSVEVVDMILVLDISSSMLADDFQPNRLEAVKKQQSILLIQEK